MLTALAFLTGPALAADVTLEPEADSVIGRMQGQRGWGASDFLYMGWASNRDRRPILRFGLDAIAPSADITGVDLVLDIATFAGNPQTVSVHRVTSDWVEGTEAGGINGATPTGASWNFTDFTNSVNWGDNGGDFASAPIGTATISGTGTVTIALDAGVVDDMAKGVLPDFGFILVTPSGNADRISIASRESGTAGSSLEIVLDGPTDNLDVLVPEMVDGVNALMPGFLDEMAPGKRRPSTILTKFRGVVTALADDGCLNNTTLENYSFGTYAGPSIDAEHVTGAEGGEMSGTITLSPKGMSGTLVDAGGTGVDHTYGDNFSGFADLQLAADYADGSIDGGFIFGLAIQDKGNQGAFVGIHGVCDGAGSYEQALNAWVGESVFP